MKQMEDPHSLEDPANHRMKIPGVCVSDREGWI